jgi:NAD(P)-dependent dehydrogenase (short-subunit alcohol dehydrogenase family)
MRNRFDVSGKTVIVTGATQGIGRAIATGFAEAGARVVVVGRNQEKCSKTAAAISSQTAAETIGIACDVGCWDAVPALVDAVLRKFGRLDTVVNNAALYALRPIFELTSDYWDEVMSVNLKGPLRLSSLAAPRMAITGGGSIINVASMGAYRPQPNSSAYASSKAALCNLTRVMAAEWAPLGIRVNAVLPGPVHTDMIEGIERELPGAMQRAAQATFLQRMGSPDELVGVALYLASDAASFTTGADHLVAGGYGI